jgi:hypothetical protein
MPHVWMTIPLTGNRRYRRPTRDEIAVMEEYQRRERKHRWEALFYAVVLPVGFLALIVVLAIVAHDYPHPFGNL